MKNNYVVEITDANGKKVKVEVNFEVWEFDKNDYWKQIWQKRKSKQKDSYEKLCEIYAKNAIPREFTSKSSENEFMKKYEKEKLWKAINSLPEKQRRRILCVKIMIQKLFSLIINWNLKKIRQLMSLKPIMMTKWKI